MLLLWILLGSLTPTCGQNQMYWAYVPDPPVLHPVDWNSPQVQIYSNDSDTLGDPVASVDNASQQTVNYTGMGQGIPMCLLLCCPLQTNCSSVKQPGCLTVTRVDVTAANQRSIKFTSFNFSDTRNASNPPSEYPTCRSAPLNASRQIRWTKCKGNSSSHVSMPGMERHLLDWSPLDGRNLPVGLSPNDPKCANGNSVGVMYSDTGFPQTNWWKIGAAMQPIKVVDSGDYGRRNGSGWDIVNVSACVTHPYALLVGNVSIALPPNSTTFNVSCNNCILTNCISVVSNGTKVFLLRQPPFVLLPVYHMGPWFNERGMQVLEELNNALSRPKRAVGLMITGIVALTALIASSSTAAVALSQQIQTAA